MKKLSLVVLFAMVFFAACNEKKENAETQTETVSEPAAADKPTSIKVGSDGVEFSDSKTEIEISTDKKD